MSEPLVMIVDDELGLLELFAAMVRPLGCRVLLAHGGQQALVLLGEQTPDLLILDLAMPGVNGYDVLRRVKEVPRLDAMRVMVLTATGPSVAPATVDPRIDRWSSKPVSPREFRQMVAALLAED
ncbi:MAG: response regulator [Anaerolineae bacterium]|nr:response regulator [Anaerolineae bacterium]